MRRRPALAAVLLVTVSLTGCYARLTANARGAYSLTTSGSKVIFTNSAGGSNERDIFWNSKTTQEIASSQCATWVSGEGIAQNGLAFRIRQDSGGWDTVVLQRNIWGFDFWVLAVVYFHTGTNWRTLADGEPGIDLGDYLGRDTSKDVFPLQVCAQLGSDNVLRFAVSKHNDPMPPLGTTGRGGAFRLNPSESPLIKGWDGTYIAHLPDR